MEALSEQIVLAKCIPAIMATSVKWQRRKRHLSAEFCYQAHERAQVAEGVFLRLIDKSKGIHDRRKCVGVTYLVGAMMHSAEVRKGKKL